MVMGLSIQLAMILASIGWLVLMVTIIRAMNYCHKFEQSNRHREKELTAITHQLHKTNEHLGSLQLEISSVKRTLRKAITEQMEIPQIDEVHYADNGISRELRHEDELLARSKEEAKTKAKTKNKGKAKNKNKSEDEAKEPKIPLPPHRRGPVVEIIPKMEET